MQDAVSRKHKIDLKIRIGKITFSNPIWAAAGTFGNGEEFLDFVDLEKVGAIVTKTVTLKTVGLLVLMVAVGVD